VSYNGKDLALSKSDLLTSLSEHKSRIEDFLSHKLDALEVNHVQLHQAMRYGLLQGGKRIRPFLVYATGGLTTSQLHDLDAPAAALECIHSYSLIHDDLPAMDDDELRRGLPTVHKKFDQATAILAGDSLLSLAFELLTSHDYQHTSPANVLKMVQLLAHHSGYPGMCGGQALDLSNTNKAVDLAAMEQMHQLKTGALIKSAVLMASYCNNDITEPQRQLLATFAHNIGLAFQVQDDILDVIGDTQVIGKPKGSDQQANKSTYVSLLGLEQAQQKAQDLYQQSLLALQQLPYDTRLLEAFALFVVQRNH
jgi:farnesyl diphosphate synthase